MADRKLLLHKRFLEIAGKIEEFDDNFSYRSLARIDRETLFGLLGQTTVVVWESEVKCSKRTAVNNYNNALIKEYLHLQRQVGWEWCDFDQKFKPMEAGCPFYALRCQGTGSIAEVYQSPSRAARDAVCSFVNTAEPWALPVRLGGLPTEIKPDSRFSEFWRGLSSEPLRQALKLIDVGVPYGHEHERQVVLSEELMKRFQLPPRISLSD